tara:strand:+ start:25 stop:330 length:306 start_codon:yes stop_codon:yes gene_type:complete
MGRKLGRLLGDVRSAKSRIREGKTTRASGRRFDAISDLRDARSASNLKQSDQEYGEEDQSESATSDCLQDERSRENVVDKVQEREECIERLDAPSTFKGGN